MPKLGRELQSSLFMGDLAALLCARWRPLVFLRFHLALALMIGLYLQQGNDAITDIIVLVDASTVLLIAAIEELATVILETGFENHEVTAVVLPDDDRTFGSFAITGTQADVGVGVL